MTIKDGFKVPDFNLVDQKGNKLTLDSLSGKPAVLYFYPKDETPGCTVEACEFRDIYGEFNKLDCEVYGISPDDINSHNKFINKHSLPFTILCDPEKKMIKDYGVWGEKNMYGKVTIGMKRMTFLVNEKGAIEKIWGKVKPEGHAQQIIDAIS